MIGGMMIAGRTDARNLSDQVVNYIIGLIESGQLQDGDKLPSERDLANKLGVGRPVVREGYRMLQGIGVIDVRHGVGAILTKHSHQHVEILGHLWEWSCQIEEVLQVRDVNAGLCGELAAKNMTDLEVTEMEQIIEDQRTITESGDLRSLSCLDRRFHSHIYQSARNRILLATEEHAVKVLGNYRPLVLSAHPPAMSLTEHSLIMEAIRDRDPLAASAAMKFHALRTTRFIRGILESRQ